MVRFKIGDKVEFWSGANGRCWKPGIVIEGWQHYESIGDDAHRKACNSKAHNIVGNLVRLSVGNEGVIIVRHKKWVRHRQ